MRVSLGPAILPCVGALPRTLDLFSEPVSPSYEVHDGFLIILGTVVQGR